MLTERHDYDKPKDGDNIEDDVDDGFDDSSPLKHALFRFDKEHLPENAEDDDVLSALLHLDEEGSPEEVAENWKHRGNVCFRAASYRWDEALANYSNAIAQHSSNRKANSIYYANRAAVHLAKGRSFLLAMRAEQLQPLFLLKKVETHLSLLFFLFRQLSPSD